MTLIAVLVAWMHPHVATMWPQLWASHLSVNSQMVFATRALEKQMVQVQSLITIQIMMAFAMMMKFLVALILLHVIIIFLLRMMIVHV